MTRPPAAARFETNAERHPKVTLAIAAEAAVWLARLHGPGRTREMEHDFRAWQAASAVHRDAFERCTDMWQDIPRIGLASAYQASTASGFRSGSLPAGRRKAVWRWITTSTVACVMAAGAVFVVHWRGENAYSTNVGEQRLVVLDDGSRVLLNTDTRVRIDLAADQRTVEVARGEAFFEVAKDAARPFVVRIEGSEVVAVGTAFSVRYAPGARLGDELTVTLVEGRVNVRPAAHVAADALAPAQPVALRAGDRLQLDRRAPASVESVAARIDRPNVERVLAWKRSEAAFDDTPLVDAVAEMNRYNRTPIVLLDGLGSSGLHVSGLYRTSDSAGFASAIASLHGLQVHERTGRLELTKPQ